MQNVSCNPFTNLQSISEPQQGRQLKIHRAFSPSKASSDLLTALIAPRHLLSIYYESNYLSKLFTLSLYKLWHGYNVALDFLFTGYYFIL